MVTVSTYDSDGIFVLYGNHPDRIVTLCFCWEKSIKKGYLSQTANLLLTLNLIL